MAVTRWKSKGRLSDWGTPYFFGGTMGKQIMLSLEMSDLDSAVTRLAMLLGELEVLDCGHVKVALGKLKEVQRLIDSYRQQPAVSVVGMDGGELEVDQPVFILTAGQVARAFDARAEQLGVDPWARQPESIRTRAIAAVKSLLGDSDWEEGVEVLLGEALELERNTA